MEPLAESDAAATAKHHHKIWSWRHFWQIVSAAIGLVSMAVAIVALATRPGDGDAPQTPTTAVSPSGGSQQTTAGETHAASDASSGRCRDGDGIKAVACAAVGSRLVVTGISCTQAAVLRSWGLDPDIDQLRIDVRSVNDTCSVGGAELSGARPLTGTDLMSADRGQVSATVRLCARSTGQPEVSCDSPHEIEWTGPWSQRESTEVELSAHCHDVAVHYADRTLTEDGGDLTAALLLAKRNDTPYYRCAIRSSQILTGSVSHLGSSELPTAPN